MKFYSHKSKDFEELLPVANNLRQPKPRITKYSKQFFFLNQNYEFSLHLFVFGV